MPEFGKYEEKWNTGTIPQLSPLWWLMACGQDAGLNKGRKKSYDLLSTY